MAPPLKSATLFINHTLSSVIRGEDIAPIAPPVVAEFSSKYTSPFIDAVDLNREMAPPAPALLPVKEVHVVLVITSDPRYIFMAPPPECLSPAVLF